jgi:hypothetical protein
MTIRKLRKKQRGPSCSYCQEKAVYRGCFFTKFSCETHLSDLKADDKKCDLLAQPDYSDAEFSIEN